MEFLPAYDFLKDVVPDHTPCEYHEEMNTKSVVVPLPVLLKDEKKYAEVVDVLDQLEVWAHEIYSKAGLCVPADPDHVPPAPAIGPPARPDQPASHVPPVPQIEDPLSNVKIPCYGDQLTRVRLAGAKDLRAGCYCSSDLGKRQFTNCCLLKLFENSINTVRSKIKDTNKLQVSLRNNRI